ncbi:thioredoxin family protein [Phaeocystidibacter marisrubri]|uniref:Thioredoxin family protein n=1 Tax=Phaeocystidibacter marisrubri TaxID=1577780 RepID=A0A6L3ZJG0_9FLAO|nr:thioredoxin family protein [Phaeocystidibacter marisrubri]KAB2818011.1 thioredoxin family protein [Phaeocystidibacter marisrubri]GGH72396.1 thioredoxin [Phaeocystidibacter marisrubri]
MDAKRLSEAFNTGWNYAEYRKMLSDLLADGKTTGPDQSEGMIEYAQLNNKRMDRGDKTVVIPAETVEALNAQSIREKWLVITEGWCGDASQIVPVLSKMEEAIDGIEVKFILRDENLDIMDAFQTNGTRSIPKVIRMNADTSEVLGSWGPRPAAMQAIVDDWKEKQDVPKSEMYARAHGAYAKDRGKETIRELTDALTEVMA